MKRVSKKYAIVFLYNKTYKALLPFIIAVEVSLGRVGFEPTYHKDLIYSQAQLTTLPSPHFGCIIAFIIL